MSRGQHFRLVLLVLTSLAFVANTQAANWAWWLPLAVCTVASPWLIRWNERWHYRAAWNLSVIAVFGVLVYHVLRGDEPHLLHDGLLLAALCQVHLLNNLSKQLKPDLLYFNSFLIAVVTSFLARDAQYLGLVAVYIPVLCAALQVRYREERPDGGGPRDSVVGAVLPALSAMALAVVAFIVLPRDFDRRGLLFESWMGGAGGQSEIGFSDSMDLEQSGPATSSEREVAEIRFESGPLRRVPAYWRGATLDSFDGKSWERVYEGRTQDAWRQVSPVRWRRQSSPRTTRFKVEPVQSLPQNLFLPLETHAVELDYPEIFEEVHGGSDDVLRLTPLLADRSLQGYTAVVGRSAPTLDDEERRRQEFFYSQIDQRVLSSRVLAYSRECEALAGPNLSSAAYARLLCDRLRTQYRYLPPGASAAARNLDEFFAGKPAHCEYFATALVVLLRCRGIPARAVSGYLSYEWDESERSLTLRRKHAHAWVEMLDPGRGWVTLDATPVADQTALGEERGPWTERFSAWVSGTWDRVIALDSLGRRHGLAGLLRLALWAGGAALSILVLALAVRRFRSRHALEPSVREYLGTIGRLGVPRRTSESPRELISRARPLLHPRDLHRLRAATQRHEERRYRRRSGVRSAALARR